MFASLGMTRYKTAWNLPANRGFPTYIEGPGGEQSDPAPSLMKTPGAGATTECLCDCAPLSFLQWPTCIRPTRRCGLVETVDSFFHHRVETVTSDQPRRFIPRRGFLRQAAERSRDTVPAACFYRVEPSVWMASLCSVYRSARAFRRRSSSRRRGVIPADGPAACQRKTAGLDIVGMELPPRYWKERAQRLRKTADFVDDQTRDPFENSG